MNQHKWLSTLVTLLKENLLSVGVFLLVLVLLAQGLDTAQEGSAQEQLQMVEQSINRAIISCYAIEGMYPESFAYLQENYALAVDSSKYYVQYSIFASNIMPQVTVMEVGS